MTRALRIPTVLAAAAIAFAIIVVPPPQDTEARAPDRVCGIEPGDGAFNYFEVWGVKCRAARKVSRQAGDKFCERENCDNPPGQFISGTVDVRKWSCKMRLGYESYRARCRKNSEQRFVHRAGA
jgi:hypothetical protein